MLSSIFWDIQLYNTANHRAIRIGTEINWNPIVVRRKMLKELEVLYPYLEYKLSEGTAWYFIKFYNMKNLIQGVLCDDNNKAVTTTFKEFTERTMKLNMLMSKLKEEHLDLYEEIKNKVVYFYCIDENILEDTRSKFVMRSKAELFCDKGWKVNNDLLLLSNEADKSFQFMENGTIYVSG